MSDSKRKISTLRSSGKASPGAERSVSKADVEAFREKISELISRNPAKAATLLTEWIKKPASHPKKKVG